MVRKLVLAVAAASALMSSNMVQALGVGEIHLRSALNQPLEAEIELLQVRDLTSSDIRSVLASADAFGQAGIDRSFFLTDLKFTPTIRPDGKSVIKVTSTRPVKEPYLNFLMEVRWPSGRVLREFTLLLDPPMYQPAAATAAVTAPAPVASSTATGSLPPPVKPAVRPAQGAAVGAAPTATPSQWQASRNDTLWEIALQHRPGGASVQQTMLAIQDINPHAFVAGNINNLKAGQTLTLPTEEQASARSRADAAAEVVSQNSVWQNRKPVSEAASRQLDARERTAAGPAPVATQVDDTLRLVSGSDEVADNHTDSAGDGQNSELRDALDRTKEQLDSSEREKIELSERLADVQAQLQTLQRLVTLKDAQLAALQQELGDDSELADILPVLAEAETVPDESEQIEHADATEQTATVNEDGEESDSAVLESEPVAENLSKVTEISAEQPDVDLPAQTQAADLPTDAPAALEQPSDSKSPESLLQQFMQNQSLLLGAGAAGLLLLLLALMAVARRNARREADLADSLESAEDVPTGDMVEETDDFNVALAVDTDAALGINQDPLTEADGLIAYAKLDEAAQVLEAAIEQETERADLRLKMMEVEARRENPEGYKAQAEALRQAGVANDAIDMMNLRYPLMAAGLMTGAMLLDSAAETDSDEEIVVAPASLDSEEVDFEFNNFGLEEEAAASLADNSDLSDAFSLDFDLNDIQVSELDVPPASDSFLQEGVLDAGLSDDFSTPAAPASDVSGEYELVLGDELQADNLLAEFEAMSLTDSTDELEVDQPVLATEEPEPAFSLSDEELAGFEVQLQNVMGTGSTQQDELAANNESLDYLNADAVLDGDLDDFDFLADTDECATKLDLARAYIDMGDADGARDILAEVVEEGNQQQQQDAREMMEQLS